LGNGDGGWVTMSLPTSLAIEWLRAVQLATWT
jgi:hypothetical protein